MKGASNVQGNLIVTLNVLSDCLVCIPGDMRLIKVGEDPMVGSSQFYKLSNDLLDQLHQQGISILAQVDADFENGLSLQKWKSSVDLNLQESLKDEWDGYTQGLQHYGIQLCQHDDELVWS